MIPSRGAAPAAAHRAQGKGTAAEGARTAAIRRMTGSLAAVPAAVLMTTMQTMNRFLPAVAAVAAGVRLISRKMSGSRVHASSSILTR